MAEIVITCDDVFMKFGRIHALRGLTFEVSAGEIFGLIGPNGSGKTTAVRIMLGFYSVLAGRMRILGHCPASEFSEIGPHLGVILDRPGLDDALTAEEYLEFYGGLLGLPRGKAKDAAGRALKQVHLFDRRKGLLGSYSKGMRQRVSLARCLLKEPQLLILDEPFDGIDSETRREMTSVLPELSRASGMAIFVTSHNLPELERICDRFCIIKSGRTLAVGDRETLCRRLPGGRRSRARVKLEDERAGDRLLKLIPDARRTGRECEFWLDTSALGADRKRTLRLLLEHDIAVTELTNEGESLEDVYFALTEEGGDSDDRSTRTL